MVSDIFVLLLSFFFISSKVPFSISSQIIFQKLYIPSTSVMAMVGSSDDQEKGSVTLKSPMAFAFSSIHTSSPDHHLTVWRQSLLFNGNGYTVYNHLDGSLVFRVDNYASDWKQQMFLMDSSGHVLFTICRCHGKKLSILESWEAFKGDKDGGRQMPFMVATKAFRNPSCSITVATGDKYRMKWSDQEGWSKIFPEAAATLPIAQVRIGRGSTFRSDKNREYVSVKIRFPMVLKGLVKIRFYAILICHLGITEDDNGSFDYTMPKMADQDFIESYPCIMRE